ncbi:hypothetical protein GCM10007860_15380 [Chitiniphilus shinanonensis]|uniref:Flagellar FliJ protein n=1 Tax=Chitiniphilus shinanonensis TaxID=553088 RepID=A0ABQ6BV54_9NEIS|nr:hypothetical protein [Chitiniphilus shinanonensis]GLS04391.1 hypothetical protein GCM10007860_15380 [Chitiniphilus shinanonensis]
MAHIFETLAQIKQYELDRALLQRAKLNEKYLASERKLTDDRAALRGELALIESFYSRGKHQMVLAGGVLQRVEELQQRVKSSAIALARLKTELDAFQEDVWRLFGRVRVLKNAIYIGVQTSRIKIVRDQEKLLDDILAVRKWQVDGTE